MSEQIQIMFDENTGRFVIHYSGVKDHETEHQITDDLVEQLRACGFEIKIQHTHTQTKIPKATGKDTPTSTRQGVKG